MADGDQALADACSRRLREPATRARLGARGRELVAQHYSFERFRETVVQAVQGLTPPTVAASPADPAPAATAVAFS